MSEQDQGADAKPEASGAPDNRRAGEAPPLRERGIATRFKPGISPNPAGRPKTLAELRKRIQQEGPGLVDELIAIVFERPDWVPDDQGRMHMTGPSHAERIAAAKVLLAYGYGNPQNKVEVTGPGGGPVQHVGAMAVLHRMDRLTTGNMRRQLDALEERRRALLAGQPAGGTAVPASEPVEAAPPEKPDAR